MQIPISSIPQILSRGDRRSIGRVNVVVAAALEDPTLVSALNHDDVVVRMHAGDALKKLHRHIPEHVARFRPQLLELSKV